MWIKSVMYLCAYSAYRCNPILWNRSVDLNCLLVMSLLGRRGREWLSRSLKELLVILCVPLKIFLHAISGMHAASWPPLFEAKGHIRPFQLSFFIISGLLTSENPKAVNLGVLCPAIKIMMKIKTRRYYIYTQFSLYENLLSANSLIREEQNGYLSLVI